MLTEMEISDGTGSVKVVNY